MYLPEYGTAVPYQSIDRYGAAREGVQFEVLRSKQLCMRQTEFLPPCRVPIRSQNPDRIARKLRWKFGGRRVRRRALW